MILIRCNLLLILAVCLFWAADSFCDPPIEEWVARFDRSSLYDTAYSIAVDDSGYVYVTGCSEGPLYGYDIATVKYDPDGNEEWTATYNGPANLDDEAFDLAVDGAGNVYVTGYCVTHGSGSELVTIMYDSNGNQKWVATFNGTANGYDWGTSIALHPNGMICVSGYTESIESSSDDCITIMYSALGAEQWASTYIGAANMTDGSQSIAIDPEGNVYVAGESYSGPGNDDFLTIKYNIDGDMQWAEVYDGSANLGDFCYDLAVDSAGNAFVTGKSNSTLYNSDYLTIKYSSDGVIQWEARYDGPDTDTDDAYAIALDDSGNVFVTGTSTGIDTYYDVATVKYNADGVQQWVSRYDGPLSDDDTGNDIAVDGSGNVYVTGYITTLDDEEDYITICYDCNGAELWAMSYNGTEDYSDEAYELALDNAGNVYVTGYSEGTGTYQDFVTIKYSQDTGIQYWEESTGIQMFPVFPNPCSDFLTVSFYIAEAADTRVNIYNISGRLVSQPFDDELDAGLHQVQINNLPAGLYFCSLESGHHSMTEPFAVIR